MRLRPFAPLFALLLLVVVAAPADAAELGSRGLHRGSHGHDVKVLQRALTTLSFAARPYDGVYGAKTARAAKRWKRSRRLRADGVLTRRQTKRVRGELLAARQKSQGAALAVAAGARGPAVLAVQQDLTRLHFYAGPLDGVFADTTGAAIGAYRAAYFATPGPGLSAASVARLHRRVLGIPPGPHVFPIAGTWGFSGKDGRYGAGRPGHRHGGQDMPAAAGTPLVAVTSGVVTARAYQASGAGNYLVLAGDDGFDYVYMHLARPASVARGTRVLAGAGVGVVGSTGDSTGPHLHFETWTAHWYTGGKAFDPLPTLQAWR